MILLQSKRILGKAAKTGILLFASLLNCALQNEADASADASADAQADCNFSQGQVTPAPDNASLLAQQFYIDRRGESGTIDLNLSATARSVMGSAEKGTGVKVSVLDIGTQIFHEDLRSNIGYLDNLNVNQGASGSSRCLHDPAPPVMDGSGEAESHGTEVSGIIAARDFNGKGIRGIAPRATLSGVNILNGATLEDFIRMVDHLRNRNIQLTNNSFGATDGTGYLQPASSILAQQWQRLLGSSEQVSVPLIFAGGNGGAGYNPINGFFSEVDDSLTYPLDFSSFDESVNRFYSITVAAVNRNGSRSFFSEKGANIWIAGFGSEITTTTVGNSYSREFRGTSAAAPVVAGVVTLMLEAAASQKKTLSYRDVRLILAESGQAAGRFPSGLSGLITNSGTKYSGAAGGYKFHTGYGFGLVDATEAIRLTTSWTPIPANQPLATHTQMSSFTTPIAFADDSTTPAAHSLAVNISELDTIEYMYVFVRTRDSDHGDLEVRLRGSAGTEIVLLEPHFCRPFQEPTTERQRIPPQPHCSPSDGVAADLMINGEPWRFGNAAHLGESPNQTWTIEVRDLNKNDRFPLPSAFRAGSTRSIENHDKDGGMLDLWGIEFFGRKSSP